MWLNQVHIWLEDRKVIACLLLFLVAITFFIWLQYFPGFSDPDSYYHTKVVELMIQAGPVLEFPYLPFTTLSDNYTDHHFLYHLYLIPFVNYLPPLVGVKIAHALLAALVIVTFFWLLIKLNVRGAFWYTGLLFFSPSLIFRLSLVKAQPLALILFFIGIYLILARRYYWLLALAFIYVWSYGGWILLLLAAGLYVLVSAGDEAIKDNRRWWRCFLIGRKKKYCSH